MVATVRLSSTVFIALALSFLAIAVVLAYIGLEEWNNCEQDYAIRLLKNAGEQARIAHN